MMVVSNILTLKSTTHALALKPKPLVVRSTDRGRDPGFLLKWHRLPRLWHRLPRLSALVTESEVTAQLLPCAIFLYCLFQTTKLLYSPDDAIGTAAA